MSEFSLIGWTDATWNPVIGCSMVSPGCAFCYAMKDANRMAGNPNLGDLYKGLTKRMPNGRLNWTGVVRTLPARLGIPLRWTQPKFCFVNSNSDLFHEQVPLEFILRVFEVMRATPWHTYQILTKRAERLEELSPKILWPDNVWMGVSVENQANTYRIDHLRQCGAYLLFVSFEPLIGPTESDLTDIGWAITGGESGVHCRDFDPDWALSIRDQCRRAGVSYFHKQNGGRKNIKGDNILDGHRYEERPAPIVRPIASAWERRRLTAMIAPESMPPRTAEAKAAALAEIAEYKVTNH